MTGVKKQQEYYAKPDKSLHPCTKISHRYDRNADKIIQIVTEDKEMQEVYEWNFISKKEAHKIGGVDI